MFNDLLLNLFEIGKNQVNVELIKFVIGGSFLTLICIVSLVVWQKCKKDEHLDYREEGLIFSCFVGAISFLFAIVCIFSVIARFINPDYYALRNILKLFIN